MEKQINKDCIQSLKQPGTPIVIAAAVKESEVIANACKVIGINVSAFCDSEKRKSKDIFCDLEVIHTPNLNKRFPKARILIATQQVQDVAH